MADSRAASETATLVGSSRPAAGSRYSGSISGPRMSNNTIAGTPSSSADPHQKRSSIAPPMSGPMIAPTVKQPAQIPTAVARCRVSRNRFMIRDNVDGVSVAPAIPRSARAATSIAGPASVRGEDRRDAERGRTGQQEPPASDAVAQRAGGDEQAGDQETVDVHDPQLLGAGGTEVRGQVWQREQHDEGVERDEKRRQGQHGEANPLPPAGANGCRRVVAMHVFPLSMTNPQNPARGGRRFVDGRAPLSARTLS